MFQKSTDVLTSNGQKNTKKWKVFSVGLGQKIDILRFFFWRHRVGFAGCCTNISKATIFCIFHINEIWQYLHFNFILRKWTPLLWMKFQNFKIINKKVHCSKTMIRHTIYFICVSCLRPIAAVVSKKWEGMMRLYWCKSRWVAFCVRDVGRRSHLSNTE